MAKISRAEINDVARQARERDEPLVLSPHGLAVSFFCNVHEVSDEWITLRNPIPPEMIASVLQSTLFSLFIRSYSVSSARVSPFGTFLRFPVPDYAEQLQTRQEERVYFSGRERAIVEIQHPFDMATVLVRQVFDLSQGGMSFRARLQTPFIQPGRDLPSLKISIDGAPRGQHAGRVVYVKKIVDLLGKKYFQVGVQFAGHEEAGAGA